MVHHDESRCTIILESRDFAQIVLLGPGGVGARRRGLRGRGMETGWVNIEYIYICYIVLLRKVNKESEFFINLVNEGQKHLSGSFDLRVTGVHVQHSIALRSTDPYPLKTQI